jgi:hypothetical protein
MFGGFPFGGFPFGGGHDEPSEPQEVDNESYY